MKFETIEFYGTKFVLESRYQFEKVLESGTYGIVIQAYDTMTEQKVAIKRLRYPWNDIIIAKRAYRELAILTLVQHPNIIKLHDLYTPENSIHSFSSFYIVTELMTSNLTKVVRHQLDHKKLSFLLYQILCGIFYLHKAGIIHRDLKPQNILIDNKCQLKIADFGTARISEGDFCKMTTYVSTRCYRAPEMILDQNYDQKVDVWSIGCIFAELITGKILFPGTNSLDQWTKIIQIVGSPNEELYSQYPVQLRQTLSNIQYYTPISWDNDSLFPDHVFPNTPEDILAEFPEFSGFIRIEISIFFVASCARDLLSKMLVLDYHKRISIADALQHSYIGMWLDEKEISAQKPGEYDTLCEYINVDVDQWKDMIYNLIVQYKSTI